MSLSSDIKEYALNLGFTRAGLCPADDFTDHLRETAGRGDDYAFHLHRPGLPLSDCHPRRIMPGARSIAVLALDYARVAFPEKLSRMVGRIYQARCYNPPADSLNGARLELMGRFLSGRGLKVNYSQAVPARPAGARAGIIDFGRNTFAYAGRHGSFIVLYTFLLDKELDYDRPTLKSRCPPDCRACQEACPTGALAAPFILKPLLCLAFNAWKTQPATGNGISAYIPAAIREKMAAHIHGCDLCQAACPRNRRKVEDRFPEDPFLKLLDDDFSLSRVLAMPESFFEKRIRPIMYNYIQEPKYFQRNAAVALGNQGDPDSGPELVRALGSPHDIVRGHAAWALGKIGGKKSAAALEAALNGEPDGEVKREMLSAREALAV